MAHFGINEAVNSPRDYPELKHLLKQDKRKAEPGDCDYGLLLCPRADYSTKNAGHLAWHSVIIPIFFSHPAFISD